MSLFTIQLICTSQSVTVGYPLRESFGVGDDRISHHSVRVQTLFLDYKSPKTDTVICALFEEDISPLLFPIYSSTGFIKWSDATEPWTLHRAFNAAIHLLPVMAPARSLQGGFSDNNREMNAGWAPVIKLLLIPSTLVRSRALILLQRWAFYEPPVA